MTVRPGKVVPVLCRTRMHGPSVGSIRSVASAPHRRDVAQELPLAHQRAERDRVAAPPEAASPLAEGTGSRVQKLERL